MRSRTEERLAWVLLGLLCLNPVRIHAEVDGVVRSIIVSGNKRTQTDVIRREVLFEPGDTLTVDLIEETERNLRALLFLGDVRVDVQREGPHADVEIRVADLYARAITPILSGEPDELDYGAIGLDYNFLGKGQIVEVTGEHDAITGNRVRAFFREPRVNGSRVRLDLDGEVASEGHRAVVRVSRPFFRLSESWSASVSVLTQEWVTRLYRGQSLSEKYATRERGGAVSASRSFGTEVKVRPSLSATVTDRSFQAEPGFTYAPTSRRRVLPSVGLLVWRPRYEKAQFFGRLGRVEDLQTGSWASVRVGISSEVVGSDRDYRFLSFEVNPRHKLGPQTYLLSRFSFRGRQSGGRIWNVFASGQVIILRKIGLTHSIAARARYDALGRTEDATQFLLGSARGLRGYALRRFDGSRRVLFNLEARPTLIRRTDFTVAGAVFLDGGAAWTPGDGDDDIVAAAGGGIRVGMSRVYNLPVLRADVGYGFSDRTWVLYMGLGQYF